LSEELLKVRIEVESERELKAAVEAKLKESH
jgi:hypothetical protein